MHLWEFLTTGECIFNLERSYNVRCGISRKDDALPPRIPTYRRRGGTEASSFLNQMLSDYYAYRGWGEFGHLTIGKLEDLGLEK